jgi:hypothetical protein
MASHALSSGDIRRLLTLLEADLAAHDITGEAYLVGGAVMCLAFNARDATKDVDALFVPATALREAAARVGAAAGLDASWLNDAVKGYLSPHGDFESFLDLPHLKVFIAHPRYLLAMKCAALRLGEEFHDLDDVRYLLRYLNVSRVEEALAIVTQYYDASQLLPKTRLILEELLPG